MRADTRMEPMLVRNKTKTMSLERIARVSKSREEQSKGRGCTGSCGDDEVAPYNQERVEVVVCQESSTLVYDTVSASQNS